MKTLRLFTAFVLTASALALAAMAGAGCKSTSTRSKTKFYDPPTGKLVAERDEKTNTRGLMVNSQTANPSGLISYTNTVAGSNGVVYAISETKDFKAGAANYKVDAAGIKATGEAGGQILGTALEKAAGK